MRLGHGLVIGSIGLCGCNYSPMSLFSWNLVCHCSRKNPNFAQKKIMPCSMQNLKTFQWNFMYDRDCARFWVWDEFEPDIRYCDSPGCFIWHAAGKIAIFMQSALLCTYDQLAPYLIVRNKKYVPCMTTIYIYMYIRMVYMFHFITWLCGFWHEMTSLFP